MDSPVAAPIIGRVTRHSILLGIALAATTALWAGEAHAVLDTPPLPDSPAGVVSLLRWCWTHKDATRYRDLFTADFQFVPNAPNLPWSRDDELSAATTLFTTTTSSQPKVETVSLDFLGDPLPGTFYPDGKPYPAHQQFLAPITLHLTRYDNSTVDASGMTLVYLVRGDVAAIPLEMQSRGFGPDPHRWYVERWEDVPDVALQIDHAPVITAPQSLVAVVGQTLLIGVTAYDPDEEPLTSLTAAGAPEANFVRSRDNSSGQLTWTPISTEVGVHVVTFTASNRLSGSVETVVTVADGSPPPTASLVASVAAGTEPLDVVLDARGSHPAAGRTIIGYRFDFGDGSPVASGATPTASHRFLGGVWSPAVTVIDDLNRSARVSTTITVNGHPTAVLAVAPSSGAAPLSVTLSGSSSRDGEGPIASYLFDFGDGSAKQSGPASQATHTYAAGNFVVSLVVTDGTGLISTPATRAITVSATSPPPPPPPPPPADRGPVVTAPDALAATADAALTFTVTASDPDGQAITSFTASPLPGSAFIVDANKHYGSFSWTPTAADVGTHTVLFTASNALSGTASTTIQVAAAPPPPDPNRLPSASLTANPSSGMEPLVVDWSAASSVDPDGQIVQYRFDFGDGSSSIQQSSHATHVYPAGYWHCFVTVTDNGGASASADAYLTVNAGPSALDSCASVANRLAQAWEGRSLDGCMRLLTSDFRFQFATGDPAGAPYAGTPGWTRDDERIAVGRLFSGGNGGEPPATQVSLRFVGAPIVGTSYVAGREYPWHVQVLIPHLGMKIERASGGIEVNGGALFSLVRGDAAHLAPEQVDLGATADSATWYIEGWREIADGTVPNQTPFATLTVRSSSGSAPITAVLDASHSFDNDGTIVAYRFDFGDGGAVTRSTPLVTHSYAPGSWTARVTAIDDRGGEGSATVSLGVIAGDRPPVVIAPDAVTVRAGKPLAFIVGASDPDGQSIGQLTASPLAGSNFTVDPRHTSGSFSWTPQVSDVGQHTVVFTATNGLSGTARTVITVSPPNQLPVASLAANPSTGIEPLAVDLSAAGSGDPDGQIISYRFDFGDGSSVVQTSPSAHHTYRVGAWHARVTVTDNDQDTASADAYLTVSSAGFVTQAAGAVTRFASAWTNRSLDQCRRTLAANFRFQFAPGDPAGDAYPDRAWSRDDELIAVGRLFSGGNGNEPAAGQVSLKFLGDPIVGTSFAPGRNYPWHVQVLVPRLSLEITRTADRFDIAGGALFSLVRGDSAALSQDLIDLGVRPDSTTWYIEGWRDMTLGGTPSPNQAPVAAVAATPATGVAPMVTVVNASRSRDDDGTIVAYRYDFGDGTSLTSSQPSVMHTFLAGTWNVRVTAIDDQGAQGSAAITLFAWTPGSQVNLVRNPSFETDLKYWNSYAGSQLERVDGGHDGTTAVQVTGPPVINGSFGVNDSPDIVRWTLGPGIHYRYTAWVRSPASQGKAVLRVTEYLISTGAKLGFVTSDPVRLSPDWQQLTVDYVTTAANSTLDFQVRDFPIQGSEVFLTDDIAVRNVTGPGAGTGMAERHDFDEAETLVLAPRLLPSPVHESGTLRFMTSQPGVLRVEVLDLAGRCVRRVMDERDAPAGIYELPIGRMAGGGERLGSGVYFWRVVAREGVKSGRFVLLP